MDRNSEEEKYCPNCEGFVPRNNFEIHSAQCARKCDKCFLCKEVVPKAEMTTHYDETHVYASCNKCEESVMKLEGHKNANNGLEIKRPNGTNAKASKWSKIVIPDEKFNDVKLTMDNSKVDSIYFKSKFGQSETKISSENNEATIKNDGDHAIKDHIEKHKEYAVENMQNGKQELKTGFHTETKTNEGISKNCPWCGNCIKALELNKHTLHCFQEEVPCSVCSTKVKRFNLALHALECRKTMNSSKKASAEDIEEKLGQKKKELERLSRNEESLQLEYNQRPSSGQSSHTNSQMRQEFSLDVGCDNSPKMPEMSTKKCDWCENFILMSEYYEHAENCCYEKIACSDCGEKVIRYKLSEHECVIGNSAVKDFNAVTEEPERLTLKECEWCASYSPKQGVKCNKDIILCNLCDTKFMCYNFESHLKTCTKEKVLEVEEKGFDAVSEEAEKLPLEKCNWCFKRSSKLDECKKDVILCNKCNKTFMCYDCENHLKTCTEGKALKVEENEEKDCTNDSDEGFVNITYIKCPVCHNNFEQSEFNSHFIECDPGYRSCKHCGKKFLNVEYKKHMRKCKEKGCKEDEEPNKHLKTCTSCFQSFNGTEFQGHIQNCSGVITCDACKHPVPCSVYHKHKELCKPVDSIETGKTVKDSALIAKGGLTVCPTCDDQMSVIEYQTHMQPCSKKMKDCPTCGKKMTASLFLIHKSSCKALPTALQQNIIPSQSAASTGTNLEKSDTNEKKLCPTCNNNIPRKQFEIHFVKCVHEKKTCPTCNAEMPAIDFVNHRENCNPPQTAGEEQKIYEDQKEFKAEVENEAEMLKCVTCDKSFSPKQYSVHVPACSTKLVKCTDCGEHIKSNDVAHLISCHSKDMKSDLNEVIKCSMKQSVISKNDHKIVKTEKHDMLMENRSIINRNEVVPSNYIPEANASNELSRKPKDQSSDKTFIPKATSVDNVKKHSKKSKRKMSNENTERHLQANDSSYSVQSSQLIDMGTQVTEKYEGSYDKSVGRTSQRCSFCKNDFATHQDLIDHYDTCDFRMSRCYYCNDEVQEKDIKAHQANCAKQAAQFPAMNRGGAFNVPKLETDDDIIMIGCPTCPKKFTLLEIVDHAPACKAQQTTQKRITDRGPDKPNQFSNPGSYTRENFAKIIHDIPVLCPLCKRQYPYTFIGQHGIDCIKKFIQSIQLRCPVCKEEYHVIDIDGHVSQCRKEELSMLNCLTCDKQLSIQEIARHITECKTESDEIKFLCCVCNEKLEVSLVKPHFDYCKLRNKSKTKLTCVLCSKQFKTDAINDHTIMCCHDIMESIRVNCPKCKDQFLIDEFEDHIPCQPKQSCPWCRSKYPDPEFMSHVDQCDKREVECIICNKYIPYLECKTHQQDCLRRRNASSPNVAKQKNFVNISMNEREVEKAKEATESLECKLLQCLSCDSKFSTLDGEVHMENCRLTMYRNLETHQVEEKCLKCNSIFPSSVCIDHKRTCIGKGHRQGIDSDDASIMNYSVQRQPVVTEDAINLMDCRLIKCLSCDVAFSKSKAERHTKVCVATSYEAVCLPEKEEKCLNCDEMIPTSLHVTHQRACFGNQIEPRDNKIYPGHDSSLSISYLKCPDCGVVVTDFDNHEMECRKHICIFCNEKFADIAIELHQQCCPKHQNFVEARNYVKQDSVHNNSQHQHNTCHACKKSNPAGFICRHCQDVKGSSGDTKRHKEKDPKEHENSPSTELHKLPCEYCDTPTTPEGYFDHIKRCKKEKKKCPVCSHSVAMTIYKDHKKFCSMKGELKKEHRQKNKKQTWLFKVEACAYCHEEFRLCELFNHQIDCGKEDIKCKQCSNSVPLSLYNIHIRNCTYIHQVFQNLEEPKKKGLFGKFKDATKYIFGYGGDSNSDAVSESPAVQQEKLLNSDLQDGDASIPCEFCPEMVRSYDELLLHATKYHTEETSYANKFNNDQNPYPVLPDDTSETNIQTRMSNLSINEDNQNQIIAQHNLPQHNVVNNKLQRSGVFGFSDSESEDSDDNERNSNPSIRQHVTSSQFQRNVPRNSFNTEIEDSDDDRRNPKSRQHVTSSQFQRNVACNSFNTEIKDSDDDGRNPKSRQVALYEEMPHVNESGPEITSSGEDSSPHANFKPNYAQKVGGQNIYNKGPISQTVPENNGQRNFGMVGFSFNNGHGNASRDNTKHKRGEKPGIHKTCENSIELKNRFTILDKDSEEKNVSQNRSKTQVKTPEITSGIHMLKKNSKESVPKKQPWR